MTDFLDTMPAAYRGAFGADEAAEHACIVARRGTGLAHAELCQARNGSVVCLVTDARPGLLVLVTDALLVHGFGIRRAQAYSRVRPDGRAEAVDFLELHQSGPRAPDGVSSSLEAWELEAFLQTLTELIVEDIRASSRPSAAPVKSVPQVRVYFELEALRRDEYVLLVEAPDSPGLLHAIASALHVQGARILACQIGTEGGLARDRFEVASIDGQPLSAADLCDIQLAVLESLPT
jgi:UTP:GlnB (protein PII) uridylyltransferase